MPVKHYESLSEVMKHLDRANNRPRHLLMGNGFSMAFDKNIFSYKSLYDFFQKSDQSKKLVPLFDTINTKNFEQAMREIGNCIAILQAFNADPKLVKNLEEAIETLKESLIDAVRQMHPEHVFNISKEQSKSCANLFSPFLKTDCSIFTTNYDLLMYWVLMRNLETLPEACDGFGRDILNPDEVRNGDDAELSDLYWGPNKYKQNIHYLHGGLPIFNSGFEIQKEVYENGMFLLENINTRIRDESYPIFVTAGDGNEKLQHIAQNRYLSYCYEQLCKVNGSVVTLGFSFGDFDHHIIDALNTATPKGRKAVSGLRSVYIGVFSDGDRMHIEKIAGKFKAPIRTFDAKTAKIWG